VVRRLRALALGELVNVFWLPVVFLVVLDVAASPANLAGLVLVSLVLAEGSAYWFVKVRQLRTGRRQCMGLAVFAVLRRLNVVLLIAGLGIVLWGVLTEPAVRWWPGLGFLLFAVGEHVNYFSRQIARRGRLRPSHLARDLGRRQAARRERKSRTTRLPRSARSG
jgi:hypothetical protein